MTAAMTGKEDDYPWHALSSLGELQVNGISVFCRHTTTHFCDDKSLPISDDRWNPFITVQKRKDVAYKLFLDEFKQLVEHKESSTDLRDSDFGLLRTVLTHNKKEGVLHEEKGTIKNEDPEFAKLSNSKKKESGLPSEQSVFFSFVLRKGTKLKPHGIAVVHDNLGEFEHHCTLVPKKDVKDVQFSSDGGFPAILGYNTVVMTVFGCPRLGRPTNNWTTSCLPRKPASQSIPLPKLARSPFVPSHILRRSSSCITWK